MTQIQDNRNYKVFFWGGFLMILLVVVGLYFSLKKWVVKNNTSTTVTAKNLENPKISATNQFSQEDVGKVFLGKRIVMLNGNSINTQSKLPEIPDGSTYCLVYLIDCEVEYNQDGDFENGSPKSNHTISIDSLSLMSNFYYKVKSMKSNVAKIYIEYYH